MGSSEEANPELESFREQWRAEVRAKNPAGPSTTSTSRPIPGAASSSSPSEPSRASDPPPLSLSAPPPAKKLPVHRDEEEVEEDYGQAQPRALDEHELRANYTATSDHDVVAGGGGGSSKGKEPVSALDHYEQAVEKEAAGSLGDSLQLYRKAFRMDHRVDKEYKDKHFARAWATKQAQASSSSSSSAAAAAATGGPAPPAGLPEPQPQPPQSMEALLDSFALLRIEPAAPEIEGTLPPPCPIATLPDELLVHILRDVAVLDVGDFVRLSQVCKRLAYLVATEDRIWRRVCLGPERGFGGMHYHWQLRVDGSALTDEDLLREAEEERERQVQPVSEQDDGGNSSIGTGALFSPPSPSSRAERHAAESLAATHRLLGSSQYGGSWRRMFRQRPRVRFNGCYISTVNYMRSGQASSFQATWGSPVHIVTYYRYLRLFRDGSALSLLTTAEPADVVHLMTREAAALHGRGANTQHHHRHQHQNLPSSVMRHVLRGRWRLAGPAAAEDHEQTRAVEKKAEGDGGESRPGGGGEEQEGDLVVETEGVSKYMYRMELALRSAGRAGSTLPRNTKLVWRGFFSYNRLTDDWAEFALKNDKPFFFSRVRSYGDGE